MSPKLKDQCYYAYIVQCADRSFYTGFSNDPVARCAKHNSGKGAKYTRSRLPCQLVWVSHALLNVTTAMSVERNLKALSRARKLEVIRKRDKSGHLSGAYSGPVDYSGNLLEGSTLTAKKASARCKHHEKTGTAAPGAHAPVLRVDRAELCDTQESVHVAGHVRQPDAGLKNLLLAVAEVASMQGPPVADILRKRGFKYEAAKLYAMTAAWEEYQQSAHRG